MVKLKLEAMQLPKFQLARAILTRHIFVLAEERSKISGHGEDGLLLTAICRLRVDAENVLDDLLGDCGSLGQSETFVRSRPLLFLLLDMMRVRRGWWQGFGWA